MKKLLTPLLLLISIVSMAGFNSNGIHLGYQKNQLLETPSVKRSILFRQPASARYYDEDKCHRYRGMAIGGAVVFGVGVGSLTGGVIMIIKGIRDRDTNSSGKTIGLVYGGYLLAVLGAAMTGAGTALTIVGAVKASKYCNRKSESSLQLIQRGNTAGLALRF